MATLSDIGDIVAAWRALAGCSSTPGWRTIPVESFPGTLMAGRSFPDDMEALLVESAGKPALLPDDVRGGHGFRVELVEFGSSPARSALAVVRRPTGSLHLFSTMTQDLVSLVERIPAREIGQTWTRILARLRAWQVFMQRCESATLSSSAELALFAELHVFDMILDKDVSSRSAVESWRGPLGGCHDFVAGGGCLEVKATLGLGPFVAGISSLQQLDESIADPLFLLGLRLVEDPSGHTLPELVERVRLRLVGEVTILETFDTLLIKAGLLRAAHTSYTRRLALVSIAAFRVTGDFPRLTSRNVHPLIHRASYEINLDLPAPYVANVDDVLSVAFEELAP
jgi:hypothetical protein